MLYALPDGAYAGVLYGWVSFGVRIGSVTYYISRWILTIFSFCVSQTKKKGSVIIFFKTLWYQGYRILLNLYNLGNNISGELPSTTNPPTNTNIQFSTHCSTTSNSYKLTSRGYTISSGGQTFQSSHISTLSLEPWHRPILLGHSISWLSLSFCIQISKSIPRSRHTYNIIISIIPHLFIFSSFKTCRNPLYTYYFCVLDYSRQWIM